MSLREEQCNKVCRILDDVMANRPTERDSLIMAVRKAFAQLATDTNVGNKLGTNLAEVGTDCISRQQAIDIAKELIITIDGYEMNNQAVANYCAEIMQLPSAEPEIHHCIDCILYNKPECLMAFENACWAEPYGYCHMFTREETNYD